MKRLILLSFTGLVVLAALFEVSGLRARVFGRERYRFHYASGPMLAEEQAALRSSSWKLETLTVAPNMSIQIARASARSKDGPWLLYLPGNDKTQLKRGMQVLEALRADHDAHLAALSYRSYSGNPGSAEVDRIAEDNLAIVEALERQHGITPARLHLIGFSIGGYFAGRLTADLSERGRTPASLTLLAPGYDLVMIRPSPLARLGLGDDYQMAPFLPSVKSRSLVLQGSADEAFHGPDQGKAAARLLSQTGSSSYFEFPGLEHEALLEHEPALTRAREFLWK
ncbi:MAG: hypothetical protein B6A08_16250 [Sorangiineae bacterium NIC37A_2]|jgi:pimeloyl-ACP methyl ester carboxylesterase|nr:MAG: hypothetical protein B6A08_16250 [Sorangiineae bacterium NIC37A_2]